MAEEKKEQTPVSIEAEAGKKEEPKEEKKEEVKEAVSAKATAGKEEKPKEKKEEKPEKVEVPKKFKALVEGIEKMSVLDLAELVKILEKKFGVSAAAPVVVAGPAGGAEEGAVAEEKSVFNIELKEVGEKKIEVIKVARDIMEKGLKEAKDLVDAVASEPQTIKENVRKKEAEEIKKKFETAGAKVELK